MRAGQGRAAPTPTILASEAADRVAEVPAVGIGRADADRVEVEAVRVAARVGRRGPIVAAVAGEIQRAGGDVTSWDEIVRIFRKSRASGNAVAGSESIEVIRVVTITLRGEAPAFGADGARGIIAVCGDAGTGASGGGIELIVIANEVVGIIGITVYNGAVGTFCGHWRHGAGDFGPVAVRTGGGVLIVGVAFSPTFARIVNIETWVEGVGAGG